MATIRGCFAKQQNANLSASIVKNLQRNNSETLGRYYHKLYTLYDYLFHVGPRDVLNMYPGGHAHWPNMWNRIVWNQFYYNGLNTISPNISNHIPSKLWDEIIYPFPNFNSSDIEVWQLISNYIPPLIVDVITHLNLD